MADDTLQTMSDVLVTLSQGHAVANVVVFDQYTKPVVAIFGTEIVSSPTEVPVARRT